VSDIGAIRAGARRDFAAGAGPGAALAGFTLRDGWILIVLLAASLVLFSLLPTGRLIIAALVRAGSFLPEAAFAEITSRAALRALMHSLETGVASAILALALGLAAALAVTLVDVRGRRVFSFLFVLSMMMAPQVVALAFIAAVGPSSPLLNTLGLAPEPGSPNPLRGAGGIVAVLALHHAPLAFVTLRAGLRRIPRELVDAASIDGASRLHILTQIILPLLRGHIVVAGILCFVAGIGNFGIPALLGLPVNYLTLPTLIYRRLSSLGPSVIGDAAAVSLLLIVLTVVGLLVARRLTPTDETRLEAGASVEGFWKANGLGPVLQAAMVLALVLVLGIPLASLLTAALVPTYGVALTFDTWTLDNFVEVLLRQSSTARAFRNSLVFSGVAAALVALLALPLGYVLARHAGKWRSLIEGLFEIPYALPGIVLALACILLFLKPLPVFEISLYGTPFIIIFAYAARFLPLALKPVTAAMAQLDPSVEEAASVCGAGAWERLRHILAPAVAPTMAAGALLSFLIAFNELTVSALLWSRGTETLGVVLFSLEEAGLVSAAAAVALAAVGVVALVMLVLDRMAGRLPPDILPWR
jgi:iron(III) transport system permease protein